MHHKHILLTVALSAGLASIAWSADEPPQGTASPTAAPAAQTAPAQPANTATSAASDAAKTSAKEKTAAPDQDEKALLARGYKKEIRNGQTMYCRKEIPTGSHFETKKCGTAESMALAEQQARDLMHNSQYAGGTKNN
jgi:hypothetical protein